MLVSCFALGARAQTTRLSGPLVPAAHSGDVVDFLVSSDGARLVYRADGEIDAQIELYSASLVGEGPPVKLNGPVAPGGGVHGFWLTADGTQVVYLADEELPGAFALYATPIAGGVRTALTSTALGVIDEVAISPDGSRVACRALSTLWTMSIDGSQPPLDVASVAPDLEYRFSDDGEWIVLRQLGELFSVPADGSAVELKLNAPLAIGGAVQAFCVDPQGAHVVYLADQTADGRTELFSVPIDGGLPPVLISIAAGGQDEVEVHGDFEIRGQRVYHRVRVNAATNLFAASLDGSLAPYKLNPGAGTAAVLDYAVDPNGGHAAYRMHYPASGAIGLHVVPTDGGQLAAKLNASAQTVVDPGYRIAALGGRVAFHASGAVFAAAFDGTGLALLSSTAESEPSLSDLAVDSDGAHVVWHAGSARELYSAPIDGTLVPLRVSGLLPAGGRIEPGFALLPTGPAVIYRADQGQQGRVELFGSPLAAPIFSIKLSADLVASGFGDVKDARLSADGAFAVYRSDASQQGFDELYSVRTDGSGTAIELSSSAPGSTVLDFAIAPDGSTVAFRVQTSPFDVALRTVPIDGGSVVTLAPSSVGEYRIAPDSASAVFALAGVLHTEPLDGSAAATPIDGPPIASSPSEPPFAFTLDSTRVLYRAAEGESVVLYSVSVEGATYPVDLSPSLVAGGSVREFAIDAVSGRAVYLADSGVPGVIGEIGLYSAPIDGALPAVELDALVGGGNDAQPDFRFGPGGSVLFRNGLDLFAAPIDGGGAPSLLVDGVLSFRLSPDGTRIVYRRGIELASQTFTPPDSVPALVPDVVVPVPALLATNVEDDYSIGPDGTRVLFRAAATGALESIAIDGSGGAVELSALQPSWRVVDVLHSADGRRAIYRVDHGGGDLDLYATPIAHTQGDLPLTDATHPSGDVAADYRLVPDGSRVVFAHDADVDGAFELFAARIGPRVVDVSPSVGLAGSGVPVAVRGSGFVPDMTVSIGRLPAQIVQFVDSSEVSVVPAVPPAVLVDPPSHFKVSVEVSDGVVTSSLWNAFTFFTIPLDFTNTLPLF